MRAFIDGNSSRRSKLHRRSSRAAPMMSHRDWLVGRFRATGRQTAMARACSATSTSSSVRLLPTPAFRHDHVGALRKTRTIAVGGQGVSVSSPIGLGRTRDDVRTAGDRHPDRGTPTACRSASRSSARHLEDRTPLAFAATGRARVRRLRSPRPATHRGDERRQDIPTTDARMP